MPVDPNFLSPLGFIFTVSKMPKANFLIQRASVPGVALGEVRIPSPFTAHTEPGNVEYDKLNVDFLINEDMSTYLEVFDWIVQKGNPYSFDTYDATKYDARLIVLDSSKRQIMDVSFEDVFPIALSPVDFDATISEPTPITCSVTFSFDTMRFNR